MFSPKIFFGVFNNKKSIPSFIYNTKPQKKQPSENKKKRKKRLYFHIFPDICGKKDEKRGKTIDFEIMIL